MKPVCPGGRGLVAEPSTFVEMTPLVALVVSTKIKTPLGKWGSPGVPKDKELGRSTRRKREPWPPIPMQLTFSGYFQRARAPNVLNTDIEG